MSRIFGIELVHLNIGKVDAPRKGTRANALDWCRNRETRQARAILEAIFAYCSELSGQYDAQQLCTTIERILIESIYYIFSVIRNNGVGDNNVADICIATSHDLGFLRIGSQFVANAIDSQVTGIDADGTTAEDALSIEVGSKADSPCSAG